MAHYIDADAIPYIDLNSDMPQSKVRVWVAFKEKIDRLPTIEAEPRWISVTERLPKVAGWYFCTVDAEHRSVRELNYAPNPYYDKDKNTWRNPQGRYLFNQLILAWMPLPEPYKEQKDG